MSSSKNTIQFPITVGELQAIESGIPTYCPNFVMMIAGNQYTAAQSQAVVQSLIDALNAVQAARGALQNARAKALGIIAVNGETAKAIRQNLAGMFSNDVTILAAFGIAPKKPRAPLSAAARLAATAKAEATRKARGTTSKKQRQRSRGA